ncbi:MAG: hemagglutinin repeat-containing protein [Acetobacter sp.]|nr:hemagglutinin repeat-containing protein [Acetobacter sp.]
MNRCTMNYKNYLSRKQIRLSTYLLLSSVSFATFAFAQNNNIVVDTAAHQGAGAPNIVQSSNGTDVLNIVKPTAGGVSHNKFLEYNVSDQNLILNNHAYKTGIPQGESTLGGTVAFNPNFGTGDAARVILNEVTSNSTTALEGYTEIFGQRAALVIANPNGITAAGAGFINLSRLTMVTGKPNVVEGKLEDFAISPVGTISIEGKGEQAFGLHVPESPAELVSNTVKVAGNIYVDEDQELTIKTGNDKYDYNTKQITSKNDTTTQPTLALDSSALGGMYAGRIKIEATQSGMGIKTDGNLVADMDNLEITADGDIVFKNVAAKNNIKVASKSGSAEHKKDGIAHAEKDLTITAGKNIQLNGTAYASNNISAEAKENIGVQGTAFAENNINLTAHKDVTLEGEFILSDTLNVKAGQNVTSAMQIAAVKNADLIAGNDFNLTKEFINADTINIEVKNNLTNDGKLVADTDLTVNVGKNLTNNDTILAQNTATLEVGGDSLLNSGSVSAKNLTLKSGTLTNNAQIATDETLTLNTTGDITNNSKINAGTDASLSADNIHNLGQIAANGNINISTKNDYVNHRDSGLLAGADVVIEAGKDIINYLAEIFAGNNIELKGKDAKIGDVDPNKVYDNPNVENNHTSTSNANNNQDIQNGEFDEEDDGLDITLTDLGITLTMPAEAFDEEPNLGDSYTLDGYTIYIGERIVTPSIEPDGEPTITFQNVDKLTILDADGNEVNYSLWDEADNNDDNVEIGGNTDNKTSETIKDQITNTPFTASQDQFNALVNLGGRIESFNDITIKSDKLYNMGLNHNTGSDAYSTYYDKIRDKAPYNAGWLELGRYKISEVHLDAEAATILAGHDLNINSRDILNQSSTFSAKNNATINTAQLVNQTYSEVVKLAIKKQRRTKKKKHFRTKKKTYNATEYYNERIYSNEASLVTAGNNLVINASGGNVVNDQVEAATGSFRFGRDEVPDLKSGQVPVDLTLPRGDNGMFAVSDGDPKYMIRSNVDFFNNIPFVGSDYFFDRITPFSNEYNTRKMLGDPAYETRLIMDAIRQATYGHYLGNGEISNDLDQMKALYNNAAKEYERLGLKIGVALTAEQIAQLNSDIIWYVEKEVNGEKVLVPELYLCQATLDDIKIGGYGAKMTGKNIAINADNISNSGDIFAKNELALKAKNLLNESNRTQTARIIGGRTDIEADTLINRSATIGGEVTTIKANDILNETKKYTEETRRGKNYDLIEKTGQEAVISGDKGLQIEANSTYAAKGAKLESKEGDVSLKAENIILDTVELHNREERSKTKSGFMSKKTTTTVKDKIENVGSAIVAGGNALIDAVKDIFSKGSKVEAGKDAQLTAGGDVTAIAAEDSQYSYSKTKKSSWGGLKKSTTTNEAYEEKLKGSNVTTKDGLTIKSGKDTNIIASDVNVGGNALIIAENINISSDKENSYQNSNKNKSSLGGLKSSKDKVRDKTSDVVKSTINVGNDLNLISQKDTNITGSDINVRENANILAGYTVNNDGKVEKSGEKGSVNIQNDVATGSRKTEHKEKDFTSAALAATGMFVPAVGYATNQGFDYDRGKISWSATLGSMEKENSYKEYNEAIGSELNIGGNLNIGATENINIKGSDIYSQGDSVFTAGNDLNIVSAENTSLTDYSYEKSQIKVTAGVGNAYVDAAYAVDDLVKAQEEVNKAKKKLHEMEELHKQGKATSEAVSDAKKNVTAAEVNLATATIAAATAAATAASGTATSLGTGVYADAGIQYDTESSSEKTSAIVNKESTVAADGNIQFNVGNDMNQLGSLVVSTGNNVEYNIANDLNVSASQDLYSSESKSGNASVKAGVNTKAAISADASAGKSTSRSTSREYNYSGTYAEEGKISINVGGDMNADGYNALAKNVDVNVKGDMNLASKQNYDYSKNSSSNFGVGVSSGPGGAGIAGGSVSVGSSKGEHTRLWTDNVASIVGTESVDVNVDGKLKMEGSLIANIDKEGIDQGNLNIKAGSLETNDLYNFERSEEKGFNVAVSVSKPGTKTENDGFPTGSTTIGIKDTGYEKEGVTHATIGKGNIEVADGSDISGINRDITNVEEITKDQITGALDATVTLDNRVLGLVVGNTDGVKDIAKDFADLPENIVQIGNGLRYNVVTQSIVNAATDKETTLVQAVNDYIRDDKTVQQIVSEKELIAALNGATNLNPEQVQSLLTQVAEIANDGNNFKDLQIANIDGKEAAFSYIDPNGNQQTVSINLANVDLADPNALVQAIYHEGTNFDRHEKNDQTAINRGDTAEGIFKLKNFGNENTNPNKNSGKEWVNTNKDNQVLVSGSQTMKDNISKSEQGNGKGEAFTPLVAAGTASKIWITTGVAAIIGAYSNLGIPEKIQKWWNNKDNNEPQTEQVPIHENGPQTETFPVQQDNQGWQEGYTAQETKTETETFPSFEEDKGYQEIFTDHSDDFNGYNTMYNIDNSIEIPDKAKAVLEKAQDTDYKNNLPGLKGGKSWQNNDGKLPDGDYVEFDVFSKNEYGRTAERIVIDKITGKAYYTPDHYQTFKPIN